MSNPKELEFPWLKFLWSSLFWSYTTLIILTILRLVFAPSILGGEGETWQWSDLLSISLWWEVFGGTIFTLLEASVLLIPSFYAGMFACLKLENKGGAYENQYKTAFRIGSTITFIILGALLFLIFRAFDRDFSDIAFETITLIIVYYIFDENVTDEVWPEIFEKRE